MSPVTRPGQLPRRGQRVRKLGAQSVGDDWTLHPFQLWGASKLTIWVGGNPIEVQLSRDQPPHPPTWDDPIPISVGPWSHAGPFGYVRFRNLFKGATGTIFGALYAE